MDAPLSSADVKILLNQRKEAKFVIASFLWFSIAVYSKLKWVCKGDCYPGDWQEYWDVSFICMAMCHTNTSLISIIIIKLQWINIKIKHKILNINIYIVTFLLYQLLIFLNLFIVYLFLKTKIARKKVSTCGRLVTIFYFTQLVDRKQTTF